MTTAAEIPTDHRTRRVLVLAVVADLVCVLAFAVAGKGSHEPGAAATVVLAIVWPFALAALAAHAGLFRAGRATERLWPAGGVVLAVTYVLGMVLRVVSGRGIAPAFLVVAVIFLATTMLGWRGVVRAVEARRAGS